MAAAPIGNREGRTKERTRRAFGNDVLPRRPGFFLLFNGWTDGFLPCWLLTPHQTSVYYGLVRWSETWLKLTKKYCSN